MRLPKDGGSTLEHCRDMPVFQQSRISAGQIGGSKGNQAGLEQSSILADGS